MRLKIIIRGLVRTDRNGGVTVVPYYNWNNRIEYSTTSNGGFRIWQGGRVNIDVIYSDRNGNIYIKKGLNMNRNRITNVADPIYDSDVVTKGYVDSKIGTLSAILDVKIVSKFCRGSCNISCPGGYVVLGGWGKGGASRYNVGFYPINNRTWSCYFSVPGGLTSGGYCYAICGRISN